MKSRPITRERRVENLELGGKGTAEAEPAQSTARKTDAKTLLNENMMERARNAGVGVGRRMRRRPMKVCLERRRERVRLENPLLSWGSFYTVGLSAGGYLREGQRMLARRRGPIAGTRVHWLHEAGAAWNCFLSQRQPCMTWTVLMKSTTPEKQKGLH